MPLNVTVLEFAVKDPLFVQLPLTVREFAPIIVSVPVIVILLHKPPAAPMLGEKVVPEGIITLVDEVGTELPLQFAGVFQSILVPPCHEPAPEETFNTPVAAAK